MSQPIINTALARELIDGITTLNARVETLVDLPAQVEQLTAATVNQSKRTTRNLVLIVATIIGLCLDLGVSVVFWRQHIQQDCLSSLRAQSATIADLDRRAADTLLRQIFTEVTTAAQAKADYAVYVAARAADDATRKMIGVADSRTCPLF